MICMKNRRFASRPRAKVRCQGPPGSARAQHCKQKQALVIAVAHAWIIKVSRRSHAKTTDSTCKDSIIDHSSGSCLSEHHGMSCSLSSLMYSPSTSTRQSVIFMNLSNFIVLGNIERGIEY